MGTIFIGEKGKRGRGEKENRAIRGRGEKAKRKTGTLLFSLFALSPFTLFPSS
jgi:hypothetical protein